MSGTFTADTLAFLSTTQLIPGLSLGVLRGKQRQQLTYGQATLEPPVSLDVHTAFPMGSVTKTITATLCQILSEQGRLDLDAPIAPLLSSLRIQDTAVTRMVSMRHLLTHTSGFQLPRMVAPGADTDLQAFVQLLPPLQQAGPLGTYQYLDAGYILAGRVIEILTGQTFGEAARNLLLGPLGLYSARFLHEPAVANVHDATGYIKSPGGQLHPYAGTTYGPYLAPTGGLFLTTEDLLTYLAFVLASGRDQTGRSLLSPSAFQHLLTPESVPSPVSGRGLAWETITSGKRLVHLQRCSIFGVNGVALVVPEQNLAAAIFNNAFHGLRTQVRLMEQVMAGEL